jgi:hypothetical protein
MIPNARPYSGSFLCRARRAPAGQVAGLAFAVALGCSSTGGYDESVGGSGVGIALGAEDSDAVVAAA